MLPHLNRFLIPGFLALKRLQVLFSQKLNLEDITTHPTNL